MARDIRSEGHTMTAPPLKFCRDCKWARPANGWFGVPTYTSGRCANAAVNADNREYLVSGAGENDGYYLSSARMKSEPCGIEGKLWEGKA